MNFVKSRRENTSEVDVLVEGHPCASARSDAGGVMPGLALLFGVVAIIGLFWSTATSAVYLWHTSSAYTYGYLIAPIAAYLVWEERAVLARMTAVPSITGVIGVVAFSFVWLLADVLGINEGRHIALVGMLQGMFLAVLGTAIYWKLVFPFNYLWLMVPAGEFLYAPLQAIAHAGSTALLKVSGIPVFADGILIQVPQGNFIVDPGCAGLNFLLAAVALSLVYGKLMYDRLWARGLCVLIAVATSVAANAVRIYLIIALTEWTEQRIGLADDHLLFGWGFFALVMLALMWVGLRFAQPRIPAQTALSRRPPPSAMRRIGIVAAAVLAAAVGPAMSMVSSVSGVAPAAATALPQQLGPWQLQQSMGTPWSPRTIPGDALVRGTYGSGTGRQVDVAITHYFSQREGREAAAAGNGAAEPGTWTVLRTVDLIVRLAETDARVAAAALQGRSTLRTALYWYDTAGCQTASRLRAKICVARQRLRGRAPPGAFVAISAEHGVDPAGAEQDLRDIAQRLPPVMDRVVAPTSTEND